MEVLYWQGFVALTVVLTRAFFGTGAAVFVCVGWTAWSWAMIGYPTLAALQTLAAWGTLAALGLFFRTHQRASHLKQSVDEKDRRIAAVSAAELAARRDLEALKAELTAAGVSSRILKSAATDSGVNKYRVVEGAHHRSLLLQALDQATDWICVTSGWLGSAALDPPFLQATSVATKRGVNVYFAFGWESSDGTHLVSGRAKQALDALLQIARRDQRGTLVISRYPNHEKLLVTPAFVVAGSYNWLSNLELRNAERSITVSDSQLASSEGERLKALMVRNALNPSSSSVEPGAFFPFGKCHCGAPIRGASFVHDGAGEFYGGNGYEATCAECRTHLTCADDKRWAWC